MKIRPTTGDRTLESLKFFPYVAWGVTIFFAVFVYNITLELRAVAQDLQTQADALEAKVSMPVDQIEDFSR